MNTNTSTPSPLNTITSTPLTELSEELSVTVSLFRSPKSSSYCSMRTYRDAMELAYQALMISEDTTWRIIGRHRYERANASNKDVFDALVTCTRALNTLSIDGAISNAILDRNLRNLDRAVIRMVNQ